MKKAVYILLGLFGVAGITYFMGPKPEQPNLQLLKQPQLPNTLTALDSSITAKELATVGLRKGNEAKIVWFDSVSKQKTKYSFVYLHGFSASSEEGNPVHRQIAKKYNANLFLNRLPGHGQTIGDSTLRDVKVEDYLNAVEEALAIGKILGNEVVIIGTSFGGALTTWLASRHPEIKAIVLYSPCIKLFDNNATMLDDPWGKQIATAIIGSEQAGFAPKNELHGKYWTNRYHVNALVTLQNFLTNFMTKETFSKITTPTLLAYWYENEEKQDKVVSVAAMLDMYQQLGSKTKEKQALTTVENHVLASPILSKDIVVVQKVTENFLDKILN